MAQESNPIAWWRDGEKVDREGFQKYWAKCEDVAMHFNDLGIRFRLQALAGLAVSGGILGAAAKSESSIAWDLIGSGLVVLTAFWLAAAWVDFCYYGRLLSGAVDELMRLESTTHRGIQLSTRIHAACKSKYLGKHATSGRVGFYLVPGIALAGAALAAFAKS